MTVAIAFSLRGSVTGGWKDRIASAPRPLFRGHAADGERAFRRAEWGAGVGLRGGEELLDLRAREHRRGFEVDRARLISRAAQQLMGIVERGAVDEAEADAVAIRRERHDAVGGALGRAV